MMSTIDISHMEKCLETSVLVFATIDVTNIQSRSEKETSFLDSFQR